MCKIPVCLGFYYEVYCLLCSPKETDRRFGVITSSIVIHHQGLDDGGSRNLWNVGQFLPHCIAQQTT
jgi:hypothetical protein